MQYIVFYILSVTKQTVKTRKKEHGQMYQWVWKWTNHIILWRPDIKDIKIRKDKRKDIKYIQTKASKKKWKKETTI